MREKRMGGLEKRKSYLPVLTSQTMECCLATGRSFSTVFLAPCAIFLEKQQLPSCTNQPPGNADNFVKEMGICISYRLICEVTVYTHYICLSFFTIIFAKKKDVMYSAKPDGNYVLTWQE
jgi:hypothetical protein